MNNENTATVILQYIDPYGQICTCVFDTLPVRVLPQIKQIIYKTQFYDERKV